VRSSLNEKSVLHLVLSTVFALALAACGTEVDDHRTDPRRDRSAEQREQRRPGQGYLSGRSGVIAKGDIRTEDLFDAECAGIDELAAYLEYEAPDDSPFAELREGSVGGRSDFVEGLKRSVTHHRLNPVFVLALGLHESGWGRSAIAKEKRNLFGYQAYDDSPYESAKAFPSLAEGTDFVTGRIKEDYLVAGGAFFNGANLSGINQKYATDKGWAAKVRAHMNNVADFVNLARDR
jgi:Mannosyl-glycoprotein endo-beta-N-acetylglucosaminidase